MACPQSPQRRGSAVLEMWRGGDGSEHRCCGIRSLAAPGQDDGGVRFANLRQFTQAQIAAINLTARDARLHFGWD